MTALCQQFKPIFNIEKKYSDEKDVNNERNQTMVAALKFLDAVNDFLFISELI